jgi:hypothetical protein
VADKILAGWSCDEEISIYGDFDWLVSGLYCAWMSGNLNYHLCSCGIYWVRDILSGLFLKLRQVLSFTLLT